MRRMLSIRRVAGSIVLVFASGVAISGYAAQDPLTMLLGMLFVLGLVVAGTVILLKRINVLLYTLEGLPDRTSDRLLMEVRLLANAQRGREEEAASVVAAMHANIEHSFEEVGISLMRSEAQWRESANSLTALIHACDSTRRDYAEIATEFGKVSATCSSVAGDVSSLVANVGNARSKLEDFQRLAAEATLQQSLLMEGIQKTLARTAAVDQKSHLALTNRIDDVLKSISSIDVDLDRRQLLQLKEIEALLQLYRRVGQNAFLPLLGGWAMDPTGMLSVMKIVAELRPSVIVECGSGTSTVWLGDYLARQGHGNVISLEHDPHYASETREALAAASLSQIATVRDAPLLSYDIGGETFQWYAVDPSSFGKKSIQLLLVDGPPGKSSRLARYPAIPLLADALADGARIVLDDAARPAEQEVARRWLEEFPGLQDMGPIGSRSRLFKYSEPSHVP